MLRPRLGFRAVKNGAGWLDTGPLVRFLTSGLMKIPSGYGDETAGPSFEYVKPQARGRGLSGRDLFDLQVEFVKAFIAVEARVLAPIH